MEVKYIENSSIVLLTPQKNHTCLYGSIEIDPSVETMHVKKCVCQYFSWLEIVRKNVATDSK